MTKEQKQKSHEKCKQEAQEYLAGWQRAKADYANAQKEYQNQLQRLSSMAKVGCVRELIPILNHWKRAVQHIPVEATEKEWVRGIVQIQKLFEQFLENQGVTPIQTAGQIFDPHVHEAVGSRKEEGVPEGQVLEEAEAGYRLDDTVIAPARVIVSI